MSRIAVLGFSNSNAARPLRLSLRDALERAERCKVMNLLHWTFYVELFWKDAMSSIAHNFFFLHVVPD